MRTIPIIANDAWQSAICQRCIDPGSCCKNFFLRNAEGDALTAWDDGPVPLTEGHPFVPLERWGQWTVEYGPDAGRTYSAWLWRCTALNEATGRCSIYESRPELCRRYEPLEDRLCAMKPGDAK